jgi:hypothetical protein
VFKTCIAFFFGLIGALTFGQKSDSSFYAFRVAEQELITAQNIAFYSRVDAEKIEANKKMLAIWDGLVSNPKIMNYSFDGLKNDISILSPKNKKFKLITWNIAKNDGTHAYFGYLLVNNTRRVKKGLFKYETKQGYEFFKLLDKSSQVKSSETYIAGPDKWYGMLYYALIECEGFYTLLARDMNDKITQKKIIDVLYFKSDGTPTFGKDVFKFPKKNPKRLVFEYSTEITMSLKYDEKRNQIVYSHLGPNQEGGLLEGQYQYYGPDGSYDALELKKDKWVVIEDVDARGEKTKNDRAEKPDAKKHKKLMPQSKTK